MRGIIHHIIKTMFVLFTVICSHITKAKRIPGGGGGGAKNCAVRDTLASWPLSLFYGIPSNKLSVYQYGAVQRLKSVTAYFQIHSYCLFALQGSMVIGYVPHRQKLEAVYVRKYTDV